MCPYRIGPYGSDSLCRNRSAAHDAAMTATLVDIAPAAAPTAAPPGRYRIRRVWFDPEPGVQPVRPDQRSDPEPSPLLSDEEHREVAAARGPITAVVRIALEVFDQHRPPAQLAGHVTPRALRYWRATAAQRRTHRPSRILRIHLSTPRRGVIEATVVCELDGRVRALAARFDHVASSGWRGSALRLC